MLECNTFALRKCSQNFEIWSPATGELIGTAREKAGRLAKALRWAFGQQFFPHLVEVREKPDDSLVFSVERTGCFLDSRIEIKDALGSLVGYFTRRARNGETKVFDKNHQLFAALRGEGVANGYRMVSADGTMLLGQVSTTLDTLGDSVHETLATGLYYFLRINLELSDQPPAKMLLLGASVVIDFPPALP